tara:strand:+ start:11790 stop:12080 length:291 start_codon:yes stop_codon:yes gene_type:complete
VHPICIKQQPSGADVNPMVEERMQEFTVPRGVCYAQVYNPISTKIKSKCIILVDTKGLGFYIGHKQTLTMTFCQFAYVIHQTPIASARLYIIKAVG